MSTKVQPDDLIRTRILNMPTGVSFYFHGEIPVFELMKIAAKLDQTVRDDKRVVMDTIILAERRWRV